MFGATHQEKAYFAPFFIFAVITLLGMLTGKLFEGQAWWVVAHPEYWVHPLQTIVCGGCLLFYRSCYTFLWQERSGFLLALSIGIVAFVLWIAGVQWMGMGARTEGFDPHFFGNSGWPYALNTGVRFARLVVVVPFVEELFWRGFLLRWLVSDDFLKVPLGTFTWKSFLLVALGFTFEHQIADYPAAFLTGLLYNFTVVRSRSLLACIVAHAVTNLLLGIWILRTGQWGFW